MTFDGWLDNETFQILTDDPFHLHKGGDCPDWMEYFFDASSGHFDFAAFLEVLLSAVETVVEDTFSSRVHPPRLRRVTTNEAFRRSVCNQCVRYDR